MTNNVHRLPPAICGLRVRHDLADDAHGRLIAALESYRNVPSEAHSEALRALCYALTHVALALPSQETPTRLAAPLGVGVGKTLGVAAWTAAARLYPARDLRIVVAQLRVEQLIRLKRQMMDLGVPAEDIGLLHSKSYSPDHADACARLDGPPGYASEPSIERADADRYPVLLLSHEALKVRQDVHELAAQRDLVIWDEALLKSRGRSLDTVPVRAALAAGRVLAADAAKRPVDAANALAYAEFALSEIDRELASQDEGNAPAVLILREKTRAEIDQWAAALRRLMNCRNGAAEQAERLISLIEMAQEPLRAISVNGTPIITYQLMVPADLRRVVVLDASHNIRELTSGLDKDIRVVDSIPASVKDFGDVTVSQLVHGGGRSTVDRSLRAVRGPLMRTIVERITELPEDEPVLIFSYKLRPGEGRRNQKSHADLIRSALVNAGVDVDAVLPNGRPRFRFATWGMETGLNDYSDSRHVFLIGVYRQSLASLAAQAVGQLDDLTADHAGCPETLRRVELSELAHVVYQAAGRGAMRQTVNGRAGRMTLHVIAKEDLRELLDEVMPGARHERWPSRHLKTRTKTVETAEAIVSHLDSLGDDADYISCRQLKADAGLREVNLKTFTRAREAAESRLTGWRYEPARRGYLRETALAAAQA